MAAPVNTVAPAITGTAEVGQTLTCSTGTWTGSVASYSYQWQRINSNLENITGATSSHYTIIADDTDHELQCVVTATSNQSESTSATTLPTITVLGDWFVYEDGTGKSDAVSYVSVEDANDYHAKRGNTAWTFLTTAKKKELLVKASDYLGQTYRMRWKGYRVSADQALDWPRNYVERDDIVPQEVKNACAEMAFKANSGDLIPDLSQLVTREKIDVIEIEYSEYSAQLPRYKAIDYLLAPFLQGNSNSMRVIRT